MDAIYSRKKYYYIRYAPDRKDMHFKNLGFEKKKIRMEKEIINVARVKYLTMGNTFSIENALSDIVEQLKFDTAL